MAATAQDAVLDNAAIVDCHSVHEDAVEQLDVVPNGAVCADHAPLHGALLPHLAALAHHRPRGDGCFGGHIDTLMPEIALSIRLDAQELAGQLRAGQFPAD